MLGESCPKERWGCDLERQYCDTTAASAKRFAASISKSDLPSILTELSTAV